MLTGRTDVLEKSAEKELVRWAGLLGWSGLERQEHVATDERFSHIAGQSIVWYLAGSYDDVAFQVNVTPSLRVAVFALRYRICSGWHAFKLHSDSVRAQSEAEAEADRLDAWVHSRWFVSREARRMFRARHPECAGYSWRRLREVGPPFGYRH